jgi:ankyrin repeat protein
MKTNWLRFRSVSLARALSFALLAALTIASLPAATNDLTSTLQKGLFEEEANRNLDAAIAAYQSLITQFDKDRQVAATAAFRLGECYRKLGRTNDAIGQYQRILREFSDQNTLAALSEQNLAGLGASTQNPSAQTNERAVSDLRTRIELLKLKIEQAKASTDPSTIARILDDERLKTAVDNEYRIVREIMEAKGTNAASEQTEERKKQALAELQAASNELFSRKDTELQQLEAELERSRSGLLSAAPVGGTEAATTDEEQQEIRRIQAMIQNSPDLINAPDHTGITPLIQAAGKGQLVVARYLLDHEAGVNITASPINRGPISPMSEAVKNGHKAMVELLLSRGADVNAKLAGGTPLTDAVLQQFAGVVEVLLANHADVNQQAGSGWTPLEAAASVGNVALTKLLLDHKADVNSRAPGGETALLKAIGSPSSELPAMLIAAGADVSITNNDGQTALHLAAASSRTNIVLAVLAAGADVNARDKHGRTPLHMAIVGKPNSPATEQLFINVASILLDHGAAVDAIDDISPEFGEKMTALNKAVIRESVGLVKLLLEHNANPDGCTPEKSPLPDPHHCGTPIWYAMGSGGKGNNQILEILLEHGANPELAPSSSQGASARPLMRAIAANQVEQVQLLLRYKADPNRPEPLVQSSGSGTRLPLEEATDEGSAEIVRLLLTAGADPNARTDYKRPLLILAVSRQVPNQDIVALLLTHGADVNVRDPLGNTPLHSAVYSAKKDVVALLISSNAMVNAQNQFGNSPLDVAIRGKDGVMSADLLVGMGGSFNVVDKASVQEIIALLHEHGARSDLPRFDRIEIQRPSANHTQIAFQKGTNDWNQFSLLESIACVFSLIDTTSTTVSSFSSVRNAAMANPFRFPDFKQLVIHRPTANGNWKPVPVDAAAILSSGDCSRDVWLQWGDIVEIPEADHAVSEAWIGLDPTNRANLSKCVSRTVSVVVQGVTTKVRLAPMYSSENPDWLMSTSFMIRAVLDYSKLIRFSSDLSRVKVTRHASAKGKPQEWILDCSDPSHVPDFWVRDGDVIEIPEK